jgi:hypothetical protein
MRVLESEHVLQRILAEHGAAFEARLAESIARMLGLPAGIEQGRDFASIFTSVAPKRGTSNLCYGCIPYMQALVSKHVLQRILAEHGAAFEARLAESIARMLGLPAGIEQRRDSVSIFKFVAPERGTANFWRQLVAAVVIARNAKDWLVRRKGQCQTQGRRGAGDGGPSMSLLELAPAEAQAVQRLTLAAPQRRRGTPGQDAECQTEGADGDIPAFAGAGRDLEQLGLSKKAALAGSFKSASSGVPHPARTSPKAAAACDTATSIGPELIASGELMPTAAGSAQKGAAASSIGAASQAHATGKKVAIAGRPKLASSKPAAAGPPIRGGSLLFGADDDEFLIRQELQAQ